MSSSDVGRFQAAVLAGDDVATRTLGFGTLEHGDGYVVRESERMPIAATNGMFVHGEIEGPALAAMPVLRDRFEDRGLPFGVETREGATPQVDGAAVALGLTEEERQVGMLLDRADLSPVEATDLIVTEMRRMQEWEHWASLMAVGFEAPAELFLRIAEQRLLEPPASEYLTAFLARDDEGELVASAAALFTGDAVGVANVVTAPEHRGRGYGSAMTTWAARWGFARGATFAWLHASEMGLRIYRRLGFREVAAYVIRSAPADG